jgi:hypothetical protein
MARTGEGVRGGGPGVGWGEGERDEGFLGACQYKQQPQQAFQLFGPVAALNLHILLSPLDSLQSGDA